MTTNTTNSQDLDDLLCDLFEAGFDSPSRNQSTQDYRKARDAILAYIDAKLAQAREEGAQNKFDEGYAAGFNTVKDRMVASESRLAEIQRGVEGLTQYTSWDGNLCETQAGNHPERVYVNLGKVLALLQPQGQADTSGLPG